VTISRAVLVAGAAAIAAALGAAPRTLVAAGVVPDPECEELWREGRPPPPALAEPCAEEFRRLALEYRPALEALAFRFPSDMVWLPGEERITRMSPAELLAMRARGDALERILPERERLEAQILGGSASGDDRDAALARYRRVLQAELMLDLATAETPVDGIARFQARHSATLPERTALTGVADAVAREARERLAAADPVKFDPTLRGFVWLARLPDAAFRPPSVSEPQDGVPLGDRIAFNDPPPIDFPIPGEGGTCPGEPRRDGFARALQDDGIGQEEPPLGDAIVFGDPPPIDFPIPGDGGICPGEPRRDAFARRPQDDGIGEEEPPLGDAIAFGQPPPINFPIPGDGGVCPVGPRDDQITVINLVTTGYRLNDSAIANAPRDPRTQVVIATIPSLSVAGSGGTMERDAPADRQVPGGGISDGKPDPQPRIHVTSLGRLGPGGVEVSVISADPTTISGETLVLEPVTLTRGTTERLLAERRKAAREGSRETTTADVYCLELRREPPREGTYFRVSHPEIQLEHEPERRIVAATGRVRDTGRLVPDSDPESYFQSILQWSIWSLVEAFDQARFEEALVEHTKRNIQQADQSWTEEIERAVRGVAPQRWRDIQKVLEEMRKADNEPEGGPSPGED
jgi:hypothetical protein